METHVKSNFCASIQNAWRLILALLLLGVQPQAYALTINVVGPANEVVADYRWLVEEDATKASVPNVPADASNLALGFHTSYMPVVAAGDSIDPAKSPAGLVLDAAKRYYVSVLPRSGYQMGGAQIAPGQTAVTIVVNRSPIPTAQISVFVFEDNQPISGTPNLPQEQGLADYQHHSQGSGRHLRRSPAGRSPRMRSTIRSEPPTSRMRTAVSSITRMVPLQSWRWAAASSRPARTAWRTSDTCSRPNTRIEAIPPDASWHQTSTIEGTKGIDAWVKANEPAFFQEFGPPATMWTSVSSGTSTIRRVLNGTATITGRVVNQHMSRPPNFTFLQRRSRARAAGWA